MSLLPSFGRFDAPLRWQTVDFISDLHLKPQEPQTFDVWADYMANTPADAVIILGDLFEAWVGDDMAAPGTFEARCGQVLQDCRADLSFMRGNRDFLVGTDFLERCAVRDLSDPCVWVYANQRWVLTHGDLLCIDDKPYQAFRQQVRNPQWQEAFLAQPLADREAIAAQARAQSEARHADTPPEAFAPADHDLARQWLVANQATTMIHGHTHRPADHDLGHDRSGCALTQVVLSDWHIDTNQRRAEVLRLNADGQRKRLSPQQAT